MSVTSNKIVQATIRDAVQRAEDYFRVTNEILGVLAFTAGLACLGTTASEFYGWMALGITALAWGSSFQGYKSRLKMLREIGHPKMQPLAILGRCYVGVIGWLFLAAVAVGFLDKNGFATQ